MMKRTAIAAAVMGLMMSTAQAAPQDNTWYVGGKLGLAQFMSPDYNAVLKGVTNEDKSDVGGGGFVGYQLNSWLGFEAGYDYLGKYTFDFANGADELKLQGGQLGVKLGLPVNDALDIYTRLGGFAYWADSENNSDDGYSPLAALGLEYAMTRDWATRLEYQWIGGVGDKQYVGSEVDSGLLSVGVSYRFGQAAPVVAPPPAPAPAPAPAPEPVKVTKEFNLASDVLFDFGKASLKPAGVAALDELYGKIQAETPKDGTALVVGYTDRIGSDNSNQILSEKRAKSVAEYLVRKGIPADKISTQGRGEAEPVTGTQCDGVKGKKKLVACLAPDRRVTIQVTGTKEVIQ